MTESSTGRVGGSNPDWVEGLEESSTLRLLRQLTRLSEQAAPAIARKASLTHNELRALEHLMDQPMGPGELGRLLGVSSAAASGIIDRLEARGHAQRASHASDGRRTSVTISGSGRTEVGEDDELGRDAEHFGYGEPARDPECVEAVGFHRVEVGRQVGLRLHDRRPAERRTDAEGLAGVTAFHGFGGHGITEGQAVEPGRSQHVDDPGTLAGVGYPGARYGDT